VTIRDQYLADNHMMLLYRSNTAHPHFPEILTTHNIGVKSFTVLERYLREKGLIDETPYADIHSRKAQNTRQKDLEALAGLD
jgi:hypothetical protein